MHQILDWQSIEGEFRDTLLLGNGASIAIHSCFSYGSLLEKAREKGLVTAPIEALYEAFDTTDSELVMSRLSTARKVIGCVAGPNHEVAALCTETHTDVRNALRETLHCVHPRNEIVRPYLPAISSFMSQFRTVVSLNYDLIVYWAMLFFNESNGNWFKDCFVGGVFRDDWQSFYQPWRGACGATLVFYPHGNLALTTNANGEDRKVVSWRPGDLLTRIAQEWSEGWFPLFVSEGDTKQKESAIHRSKYLRDVYNRVIPTLGPTIAVYGWALKENDSHILQRICNADVRDLSISVKQGQQTTFQVQSDCERIRRRILQLNPRIRVRFYDADSAGCWLNYMPNDEVRVAA